MKNEKKYKFKFSIVSAVYNVAGFLPEMIDSIISQDIGFKENVQLILVDDCSTDDSFSICKKYQAKFPNNIVVKKTKTNSGNASSPRNIGMRFVKGKYLTCTDSDDTISSNTLSCVYNFFETHEDEIDVVAIPLFMTFPDGRIVDTSRNIFFKNNNFVLDLNKQWKCSISSVATTFVHSRNLSYFKFDPTIINGEDLIVVNKILLQKQKLGMVNNCRYNYRQHSKNDPQQSLIQRGQKDPLWYTHSINNITNMMFDYALNTCKKVPLFYQFTIASDLQWRMIVNKKALTVLKDDQINTFYDTLLNAFYRFDFGIIMALKNLPITEKIFILRNKYIVTHKSYGQVVDNNLFETFKPTIHFYDFHIYENKIEILGDFNDILYENTYKLTASLNNKNINILFQDNVYKAYILNNKLEYVKRFFKITINKSDLKFFSKLKLSFVFGKSSIDAVISGEKNFPLNSSFYGNYYIFDKYVMSFYNNSLRFDKKKWYSPFSCELRYLKSIFKSTKDNKFKIFIIRMIYKLFRPFYKNKKIWIVSDKADKADDNGEYFFKYLSKHKRKCDKVVFVINKKSPDFKRLKKVGKCINYLSYKHQFLSLFANYLVSAHSHDDFRYPLGVYTKYIQDSNVGKNYIFLQHGIIKSDQSRTLNKGNVYMQKFITSSILEQQSILTGNYGYEKNDVALCGMTRYDGLFDNKQKIITIAPTWRPALCGPVKNRKTDIYELIPDFKNSKYFLFLKNLLTNEKLLNSAKKYGYKIQFLPHSIFFAHKDVFDFNDDICVLGYETKYKKVFAESALMVTDYSSLVFDFAYLRKPIMYMLFDFYDSNNSYNEGYYNHEKIGLGDVTYNVNDTVDCIIDYMKNDCKLKPIYEKRIDNFFAFSDKNNCERVFNEILKLENN